MEGLENRLSEYKEPTKAEILQEKIYSFASKVVWTANGTAIISLLNLGALIYLGNNLNLADKFNIPTEKSMIKYLAAFSLAEFLVLKRWVYKFYKEKDGERQEQTKRFTEKSS